MGIAEKRRSSFRRCAWIERHWRERKVPECERLWVSVCWVSVCGCLPKREEGADAPSWWCVGKAFWWRLLYRKALEHLVNFNTFWTCGAPRNFSCKPEVSISGYAALTRDLEFALWCTTCIGGPHVGGGLVAVEEQADGSERGAKVFVTVVVVDADLVGGAVKSTRTSCESRSANIDLFGTTTVDVIAVEGGVVVDVAYDTPINTVACVVSAVNVKTIRFEKLVIPAGIIACVTCDFSAHKVEIKIGAAIKSGVGFVGVAGGLPGQLNDKGAV